MKTTTVPTRDGLDVVVDEAGPHDAPAVIFVHGIAQDRAAFRPVLEGPLAARLRCVAFDVRGHGESSKPDGSEPYERLGDDVDAVIRGLDLRRPVLAPWSYGGAIVGDYLRRHGSAALGGVFLVAAAVAVGRSAREFFGPGMMDHVRGLIAADAEIYAASADAFVSGCAAVPVADAYAAGRRAAMRKVPAHVRRALLTRDESYVAELVDSAVPLAAIHGAQDQVVLPALSRHVQERAPRTTLTLLADVGHLPFVEAESAFVAALDAFLLTI